MALAEPAPGGRGVLDDAGFRRQLVGARAEAAVVDREHREAELAHLLDAKDAAAEVLARAVQEEHQRRLRIGVRGVERVQADRAAGRRRDVIDPDAVHVFGAGDAGELVGRRRRHRRRLEDPLALLRAEADPAGREAADGDEHRGGQADAAARQRAKHCARRFACRIAVVHGSLSFDRRAPRNPAMWGVCVAVPQNPPQFLTSRGIVRQRRKALSDTARQRRRVE